MYRALLTVVLSVCIASASATTPPVPASTAAPRETAARITLQPEAKTQAKAQAQALKVNTKLAERQSLRPHPPSTSNESSAGDSGDNSYGTLLITLVLMGAIALRRRGSGRP